VRQSTLSHVIRRVVLTTPYLLPYLTLPPLFPLLPGVESIRGFAHAAGFAAARRCLRFLVELRFYVPLDTK